MRHVVSAEHPGLVGGLCSLSLARSSCRTVDPIAAAAASRAEKIFFSVCLSLFFLKKLFSLSLLLLLCFTNLMMSTPWRCASAPPTGSLTEEAPRRRPLFRQLALAMVAVARESSGASSLDLSILFCLLLAAWGIRQRVGCV